MQEPLRRFAAADVRPPAVEATVEYLGPMEERPCFHMSDPSRDRNVVERVKVVIWNARPLQHELSLDRHGFTLVRHRTALQNLRDSEEVQRVYRPELERVLTELTGAQRVLIQPSGVVRLAERAPDFGATGTTHPAQQVHSDYSRRSGPALVESLLSREEAKVRLARRFAIYSLWRAFSDPPQDVPLALCDAQSVAAQDVVLSDVVIGPPGKEIVFEGSNFRYNPRHRWTYFRDMGREELLVIKTYDSDDSRAWRVPHTGFVDPSAPPDAPARVSMDIRGVAFFDAENPDEGS
ncbi:MAG TPA: CmcJ/NvfI family oxidoreductase [Steroidobacteraceae bacterium]|nr:CmcJ/NvfI family oxidoreductase [Steroidobacteraceae bacterium]